MNEELKKLYDAIASRGFYTKSYDEFVNQYQDPAYRDKVFDVVTREGLYTKGRNEFDAKYSAAPLKKKNHPFLLLKRALWRKLRKMVHWRRKSPRPFLTSLS